MHCLSGFFFLKISLLFEFKCYIKIYLKRSEIEKLEKWLATLKKAKDKKEDLCNFYIMTKLLKKL